VHRGSQQSWIEEEERGGDQKPGHNKRQLHLELLHARQRGTRRERKLRVGESGKRLTQKEQIRDK